MTLQQISIAFTAPQLKWLHAEARRLGLSIAELLRRLVDEHRAAAR
jgi:hypothetical protein